MKIQSRLTRAFIRLGGASLLLALSVSVILVFQGAQNIQGQPVPVYATAAQGEAADTALQAGAIGKYRRAVMPTFSSQTNIVNQVYSLVYDPGSGYVFEASYDSANLVRHNATNLATTTAIACGTNGSPALHGIALGNSQLAVANEGMDRLYIVNPSAGTVVTNWPTGDAPKRVGYAPQIGASGSWVVANSGAGTVSIIDAATGVDSGPHAVGNSPYGVLVHDNRIFISCQGSTDAVKEINAAGSVVATYGSGSLSDPMDMVILGGNLIVANGALGSSTGVTFISVATGSVLRSVSFGSGWYPYTVYSDGAVVWAFPFLYGGGGTADNAYMVPLSSEGVVIANPIEIADNHIRTATEVGNTLLVGVAGGSKKIVSVTPQTTTEFGRSLLNQASASATRTTLGIGNVENTALSTWAGSANIATLGTISTGTWEGDDIAGDYLSDTTVTPGTYGSASEAVQITVDQQGRVTDAQVFSIAAGLAAASQSDVNAGISTNTAVTPAALAGANVTLGDVVMTGVTVTGTNGFVETIDTVASAETLDLSATGAGIIHVTGTTAVTNITGLRPGMTYKFWSTNATGTSFAQGGNIVTEGGATLPLSSTNSVRFGVCTATNQVRMR